MVHNAMLSVFACVVLANAQSVSKHHGILINGQSGTQLYHLSSPDITCFPHAHRPPLQLDYSQAIWRESKVRPVQCAARTRPTSIGPAVRRKCQGWCGGDQQATRLLCRWWCRWVTVVDRIVRWHMQIDHYSSTTGPRTQQAHSRR